MTDIRISECTRLHTPAARVWRIIGDFDNIADWHPRVLRSKPSHEGTQKLRKLDVAADAPIVERLEEHDDAEMLYRYAVVSGPLPIRDAVGKLWIHADTPRICTVYWDMHCAPNGVTRDDAVHVVQDYLRSGLGSLRFKLGA